LNNARHQLMETGRVVLWPAQGNEGFQVMVTTFAHA